jgi:large subunit ribosomal protein L22
MEENNTVRISGRNLPISTKHAVEICKFIRYKPVSLAKTQLNLVLKKKIAVPMKRYLMDRSHKPGMAAGFYPQKATKHILKLLTSLEGYAQHKGLDKNLLYIKEIRPNRAPSNYHPGRIRGITMKNTHIDIVAAEKKVKSVKKETKK